MSDDNRSTGSVLRNLSRPSVQPPPEAEAALLGPGSAPERLTEPEAATTTQERSPTMPVTFHLPTSLRDQLKRVALARRITMVTLVRQQLEKYLADNPLTPEERNRLLGL